MSPYALTTTVDIDANDNHISEATGSSQGLNTNSDDGSNVCVDNIGFCESWSFAWVRSFYVRTSLGDPAKPPESQDLETKPSAEPKLNLKIAFSDSCGANSETLQDLLRRDEEIHGQINASMFRACWTLCRSRLLLATGGYVLAVVLGIIAIMVFLMKVMHFTNLEWEEDATRRMAFYDLEDYDTNETAKAIMAEPTEAGRLYQRQNAYFSIGFVLLMVAMYAMRSVCSAINLRAAVMLRNACAGAVYATSLKSSVQHYAPSYQVMVFCTEDGDAIMEMVLKGSLVLAQIISITLCLIAGLIALGYSVYYGLIGMSIIFLIAYLLAMGSGQFYRKSHTFLHQKLAVADEYCHYADRTDSLGNREVFQNRFSAAVSGQFWALFRAESMRPSFSGGITMATMVGCLTFMSMDIIADNKVFDSFHTRTEHIMAYSFLAMYLLHSLVSEWTDSMMALVRGMVALDKIKIYLGAVRTSHQYTAPEEPSLQTSIRGVTFKWDKRAKSVLDKENELDTIERPAFSLHIARLDIPKNTVVGITGEDGSGMSSFVLALLDHMPRTGGSYQRNGSILYFPDRPYILENSTIRQNIVFDDTSTFNEALYQDSVATVQMHMNQNFDTSPLDRNDLDMQWLQRISVARALYNGSQNTILLENPLSSLDSNTEISDIFSDVLNKLLHQGKTVVVVSQDENILRHCKHICLIDRGQVGSSQPYDTVKGQPQFKEIVRNYGSRKNMTRNGHLTDNLQTTLNISSEELVDEEPKPLDYLPPMFNPLETFYLTCLNVFNVAFQVSIPFSDLFFLLRLNSDSVRLLILFTLIFLVVLVGSNMLVKHYVHRIARRYTKSVQRDIFDKVLNTAATAFNDSHIVASLNALLESNFRAFQARSTTVQSVMLVLLALWGFFALETSWSLTLFGMVAQFFGLYFLCRNTVATVGKAEASSRLRLFEHVHNDLDGRAVIQSFDHVRQSRNRVFELIDTNSTAIYLNKSIVYFTHFLFTLCQFVNLPIAFVLVHFDRYKTDYSYIVVLYLFFLITYHVYTLLEIRLEKIVADQRLLNAHNFKMVQNPGRTDISTLKYTG